MNSPFLSHFLTVLFSLTKYFWVLLIPVARAVLALGFDYENAFKGYEADIFLLSLLFIYAMSRWLCTSLLITEKEMIYKRGLIFRKTICVTPENTSCIKLWQNPFSVIFRCFILNVYQNPTQKPIIKMYCTRKTADNVKRLCLMDEGKLDKYKGKPLLYSLIFSNSKGGFLFLSAFLSFSGIVTGKTLRRLAQENFTVLSSFAQDIPTLLVVLGVFFLIVRLISFFLEIFYVSDMRIYEQKDFILIKRGIVKKTLYRISTKNVNLGYILSTNSILFNRYYSMYAGITGFGQGKYDNSLILPITDRITIKDEISRLYGRYTEGQERTFSDRKAISSYITKWFVLYIISCLLCSAFASVGLFGKANYIAFLPPLLFLFLVFLGMNKWRYSYISINGEIVTICYTSGLKMHRYVTECRKIAKLQIRQNVFQRRKGIADICFYLRGTKNKKVRIKHIGIEKCMEIAEKV